MPHRAMTRFLHFAYPVVIFLILLATMLTQEHPWIDTLGSRSGREMISIPPPVRGPVDRTLVTNQKPSDLDEKRSELL